MPYRLPVPGAGCRCAGVPAAVPAPDARCRLPGAGWRMPACRCRWPVPDAGGRCRIAGAACRVPDAGARCRLLVPRAGGRWLVPVAGRHKMYIVLNLHQWNAQQGQQVLNNGSQPSTSQALPLQCNTPECQQVPSQGAQHPNGF